MEFDPKWLKDDGSTGYLAGKIICDAIGSLASSPAAYGNYDWVFDVSSKVRKIPTKTERYKLAIEILKQEINRLENSSEIITTNS